MTTRGNVREAKSQAKYSAPPPLAKGSLQLLEAVTTGCIL